jgi:hypothetical protein
MPASISGKCESFVDNNLDKIVDLIVNNLTPDQICAALKMCAGKKPVKIQKLNFLLHYRGRRLMRSLWARP